MVYIVAIQDITLRLVCSSNFKVLKDITKVEKKKKVFKKRQDYPDFKPTQMQKIKLKYIFLLLTNLDVTLSTV